MPPRSFPPKGGAPRGPKGGAGPRTGDARSGSGRRPPSRTGPSSTAGNEDRKSRDARRQRTGPIKKVNAQLNKDKFKRQRQHDAPAGGPPRGGPAAAASGGHRPSKAPVSHRTKTIDIHLASKVSEDLRNDIALFKSRNAAQDTFGPQLNQFFALIPPPFVWQHLPHDVSSYRSYLSKFVRGARNHVEGFDAWYEWASYEADKSNGHAHGTARGAGDKKAGAPRGGGAEEDKGEPDEVAEADKNGKGKKGSTRQVMSKTLEERAHMRALLQMCLRHNRHRRKEGQHAFINHLNAKLTEDEVDCRSLERLRGTAHHSVTYALSRLLLGMATDDIAMMVLHCHVLYLVLQQTPITPAVILALTEEEFALDARMRVVRQRVEAHQRGRTAGTDDANAADNDDDDAVDPDDINDPTKGERNQRLTAAVFALGAMVEASAHTMSTKDAEQTATYLSFCYVEQKATRVASANVLFHLIEKQPCVLDSEKAVQWMTFAFFFYPKLEYFRPESVQMLLRLMDASETCVARKDLPPAVCQYCKLDPLEPSTLEQIANALFRREQVTLIHPMVHPVWEDLFNLVTARVASGESMKEHVSALVHTAIAPYRRGNSDIPRRTLFQSLVTRLGQLAVQSEDADQRTEMLHLASKTVGYGRNTSAKPTPIAELRQMPAEALNAKVRDLLRQYRHTKDSDPAAVTNRTWVLRELRNCLSVPVREGVPCPYVDEACRCMLEFGLFPPGASRDNNSKNRCVYLFADTFSFTFQGGLTRPKATLSGLDVVRAVLAAEERGTLRYDTARKNKAFLKARNRIVEALDEADTQRSVLFYENRDMELLLTLLFLILTVDDAQNPDAVMLAKTVVADLVQFYRTGTLETLDMFFDVLMALVMRTSAPLQVMPLMTCVRRIAVGYILRFAKFVRSKSTLDILLAPLREAYQTDSRELARQRKAKKAAAEDGEEEDDDGSDSDAEQPDADSSSGDSEDQAQDDESSADGSENGDEADVAASESATDADTATEATDDEDADSSDDDTEQDDDAPVDAANDEDEAEEFMDADEAPTQQYIEVLKGMVGDVDLSHMYPTDASSKEKGDIVRAVQLAARVGVAMRSPLVVSIYQVLLAVARENVKSSDDVVFDSVVAAIDMLLASKNRFFGHFASPIELFQLLADIQSYCRKLDRALVGKDGTTARAAANARRRMAKVKTMALRVFHFVAMLAYKNHAGEDVRITLMEYYKSIFCDRGWDMKRVLPTIKRDLFYYRQGFAWVLLAACFEKFDDIQALATPQRVRVFTACCIMVESMLSRLSGLPMDLKESCSGAIRGFLQSVSVSSVYEMKHTVVFNYLHTIKMVVQYNSRVHLDIAWVAKDVVAEAVDNDEIQLSRGSIGVLAQIEKLLELTPRARETKPAVPVKVLYQQFEKVGTKEKGTFFRRAKRVRAKVVKALLAHRNNDATDEERAQKRRRREELKIDDRIQRQVLRESRNKVLTKEEREEKRKQIMLAKQARIAKNKERKRRLHESRQKSFDRWRQQKLEAAAHAGLVD